MEENATVADNVCFLTCLYKNAVRTLYLLYFILTVLLQKYFCVMNLVFCDCFCFRVVFLVL